MHRVSRRSGRISFVLLAGICSVALIAFLFFFTGQSPRGVAGEFMTALAKGDVDKLTELSLVETRPKEEIHKEWERSIQYGRNYLFFWSITGLKQDADGATVRLDITKNPLSPSAYPEHYELQMVKTKEGWKVDVPQIARDMFPYLPQ
jgi:hypothetical protein